MMEEIQKLHQELGMQSYRLGVAETASGVLHNLRNALSPLPVDVERIRQEVNALPLSHLAQAARELGHDAAGARRHDLAEYLAAGLSRLEAVLRDSQIRLDRLCEVAAKADMILQSYDELGTWPRVSVPIALDAALVEAAKMIPEHLLNHLDMVRDDSLALAGTWLGDPIQVQQILANLLINAAEAARPEAGRCRVVASAEPVSFRGRQAVSLRLADDGSGIAPQHLERVFEREFSTKHHKRLGLGLHWCANTANAMGGCLRAESPGVGLGAIFTVILPQGDAHGPDDTH